MTQKEKRKEYLKQYRLDNLEEIKEYQRKYHANNKENRIAYQNSKKDGYYTVYYLKEEHYAGMTSRLYYRLNDHKSCHNRHIEDVEIIGKYKNKEEALRVEAALHSMGYLGGHPRHKQQTLKQLI